MTRQYTVVTDENTGRLMISYEENGFKYSFLDDPANTDYQAYLDRDKPKAALPTPIAEEAN